MIGVDDASRTSLRGNHGVYGAVAHGAAQRSREMVIRAACGAAPPILVAELMRLTWYRHRSEARYYEQAKVA